MTASNFAASSPARILIVDDEELILRALHDTLTWEGYEVLTESSPFKALEAVRNSRFAVIISDQRMPGLTGLEFLGQARTIQPNASRILITGVLSLDTVIAAINKGEIYKFVVKPWMREEFLLTVKDAVQRHELLSQNHALQEQTHSANRDLQSQIESALKRNAELTRLNEALETNFHKSLELLLKVLEAFMPALGNHARRVHHLCRTMGQLSDLPWGEQQVLEVAAWLHDIGLLAVPRHVIRRWQLEPLTLRDSERLLLEQHPVLGQELTRFTPPLDTVGNLVRAHHERLDGTGYPDKLSSDKIPWLARILAVAVGFAERNEQPSQAAEWVKRNAGLAFDPEAVRLLGRALAHSAVPRKELQLSPAELRPGMLLSRGIYTVGGELLLPEGQQLTKSSIEKVLSHERQDDLQPALLVYC